MKNKILECALRSILNPKCQDCQSNLKRIMDMKSIGINHAIVLYEDDGLHMDVVEKDVCITYFGEPCYEPHLKICQQCGKREISGTPSIELCNECKEKIGVL